MRDPIMLPDVRQSDEFTAPLGNLPHAINVPLPELTGRMSELIERKPPIVVVCRADRHSARAGAELLAFGFRDVAVLRRRHRWWVSAQVRGSRSQDAI